MNGVINFLKPPGMSSNYAVGFFKKLLQFKKIGHAGTLDPGASGVLVVLVGKATKLSDYFMSGGKTYIGEITFGVGTDTQDAYGTVTETSTKIISTDDLNAILPKFIGEIEQTPSRFSAIKVDGKRAYDLARKGTDFKIKSRKVVIENLSLMHQTANNRFLLKVTCSKGTYIRALFEDIAKALDTCAYMSFLERTVSGGFSAEHAVTMDEATQIVEKGQIEKLVQPLEAVLLEFPKAEVASTDFKRITNGLSGTIIGERLGKGTYSIYCKNHLIGLGQVLGNQAKISTYLLGDEWHEKHQV